MKRKYFVIALLLFGLAPACKKKSTSIPINADLKKYFSYKPGTYWVYKDSVSGVIDSVVVYGNLGSVYQVNADEQIDEFSVYNDGVLGFQGSWNLYENNIQFAFGVNASVSCLYDVFLEYPFRDVGYIEPLTSYFQQYSIIDFIPNYILGGNMHDSVYVIGETDRGSTYNDQFYVNTHTGILKIRYSHPPNITVLELQRYNILR